MKAILAIGSPFGEDQAAWYELNRLENLPAIQAQIKAGTLKLFKLDRPGMALLDHMRGFSEVTLLDAVLTNQHTPGEIVELGLNELEQIPKSTSSHGIGVAETLAMGEVLGLLPNQLKVLGVVVRPNHAG